jgi:hypothetical protein
VTIARSACRTVKHRLRPLLDDRLADADAALGELYQLREQLAAARTRLDELPDLDHRCDPNCAFLFDVRPTPHRRPGLSGRSVRNHVRPSRPLTFGCDHPLKCGDHHLAHAAARSRPAYQGGRCRRLQQDARRLAVFT